jgi:xanthine dehydrogenase accessory factor
VIDPRFSRGPDPAAHNRPPAEPDPSAPFPGVEPHDDASVWEAIAAWRGEGRRFALLTVTETRGFTPRRAGAHMLVDAEGASWGTIGGGAIEREALDAARALLAEGGACVTVRRHLTQELGMCCGGEMAIHVEAVAVAPPLRVLGAGHVGRAIAALASGSGFRVTLVDERPEWADAARLPFATVECRSPEVHLRERPTAPDEFVVVVTHDHALDQRLVEELLRQPARFVGMVGSEPKRRKFLLRLRARGFDERSLDRLRTPLGVAIGAATPEEIAVSVVAELIAERRGVELTPGEPPARHASRPEPGAVRRTSDTPEVTSSGVAVPRGGRRDPTERPPGG